MLALIRGLGPGRYRFSRPSAVRTISTSKCTHAGPSTRKPTDRINYNRNVSFDDSPNAEHVNYPYVSANDLEQHHEPPTRVKMLVRDFIEDSLYNPHYGYFSKQATIFSSPETSFDFGSMKDGTQFQEELARRYDEYGIDELGPGRQIWHTPTELFKPWYGQAIAQCLVSEYLLKYFPYEDFIIYEIGAGNGTLAMDVLNYIREEYPEVYERTHYNTVEISDNLARLQREKLCSVHPCAKVAHKSIFHWDIHEPAPCFFVAMEVIDNFAHDMIRYDMRTLEPYQGLVIIDENGEFEMHYTRITDPLISSFINLRRRLGHPPPLPILLKSSPTLRKVVANLPFAPNLSAPEFIPTRLLTMLETLRSQFPLHRLLLSDFASLPNTIPGSNAPVVQTRHQNTTVACETLLVKQGYFDIFFPTNFERLRDMYEYVLSEPRGALNSGLPIPPPRPSPMASSASSLSLDSGFFSSHPPNRRTPVEGLPSTSGLPVGQRKSSVFTHAEFLETYADLRQARLRNGENPMLEYYKNVKFLF